jgi:uncharacterized protein (TIGR02246 family)
MTLDRPTFQRWLDRYVAAWRANDPALVGELFAPDATYRHRPTDDAIVGRDAIVADWAPEDPATWTAAYEVLAIDGDVHVAHGETRYLGEDGATASRYGNVFVCRFDTAGRCREFTEYWTLDRASEG